MEDYINRLKQIKKGEVEERTFYEQVLTVIKDMGDISLTPETFEELKATLREIGCQTFEEWLAEKKENGIYVERKNLAEGIRSAAIPAAVTHVSQLLNDYETADFGLCFMNEYKLIEEWLKNSKDNKLTIPYYQVAKSALMNWQGLSEEEAEEKIRTSTFEEIEGEVYARGSIDYAIDGIAKALSLEEYEIEELRLAVYEGVDRKSDNIFKSIENKVDINELYPPELVMDVLFSVHDGWVRDSEKKFTAREKKHQHMPSELIGWKEAKADLLFIKPIFEAANIEVSEQELEDEYNRRVKEFFLDRGIESKEALARELAKGAEFYPALEGQESVLSILADKEQVDSVVIPQIESKGIGDIENVREGIVSEIVEHPQERDLKRLSDGEKEKIEASLNDELVSLREESEKTSIITRIMKKVTERGVLKRIIAIEKAKQQNQEQGS